MASKNKYLAYKNFFTWQLVQLVFKTPILCKLVGNSKLLVEKGMSGATGNIYVGLLEFEDMAFLLHAIKKDELFADIGANIGVYTVLAAKNAHARVIAIEPIPRTFKHLNNNVFLNDINDSVTLLPIGVSDKNSELYFTNTMDTINHVVHVDDWEKNKLGVIKVDVKKIDDIFSGEIPVILKMDIEGYEWPALKGATQALSSPLLKAVIIEINGCGKSFGFYDMDIHNLLLSYNFKPYAYSPFTRTLTLLQSYGNLNTIYIKDISWAIDRVKNADFINVLGSDI